MALISIRRFTLTLFLGALICNISLAQDAPDTQEVGEQAGEQARDLARGPVDPYQAGFERSRFLAAAGVDTELDRRGIQSQCQSG